MPSKDPTKKRIHASSLDKTERLDPSEIPAGVIGLGLMGTSIIACLLAAGHPVVGVTRNLAKHPHAKRHALALLKQMVREGLLKRSPDKLIRNFTVSEDYASLANCQIIIESIIENLETKKETLARVEQVVLPETLIGSNTSSIPVTILQEGTRHPERIMGIHWAEPAHVTRFMEIICGKETRIDYAERVVAMARHWGKEPSLLRRDIRGFITNRIMYAMLREAFYLVENGYATIEDVDRSLRNDYGYWITFAGPFRYMDLTGIPAYRAVMKDLWPELSCETKVPPLMEKLVQSGARGVSNAQGFYSYTPEEAENWEKLFLKFTY
ncbi:MAG TPA: 3-hydroxyacyl-CoA dehydrogenase family protein, partial [Terriglobia bacterium]|nr:3-hydroxyacyl-CoA dehydrogenase family protein [Terriglobia bacterium]